MKDEKKVRSGLVMSDDGFTAQGRSGRLVKDVSRPKNATFIDKLTLKAHEQKRLPLGSFTEDTQPKGFLVEVDPDPSPANSVITEVTSLGSGNRYTLYLLVSNFSSKAIRAEVWRL